MTEEALDLLETPEFRHEMAQVGARATMEVLGSAPSIRWTYRSERIIRNLTALGQAIFDRLADGADVTEEALFAARGWENMAVLGERVDPSGPLLTAAAFYELAGYQANAACLARNAARPPRSRDADPFVRLLGLFVQRLFLRMRSEMDRWTAPPAFGFDPTEADIQARAGRSVAALGLDAAASFFLSGDQARLTASQEYLDLARRGLGESGDAVAATAVAAVERMLPVMADRSTWRWLDGASDSARWKRYLRVLARGLNPDILDARSVSELWPSQRAAISGGILGREESLVVRMPTSAGKTRVAEMAMVHTLVSKLGSKCVYIAPYRALATEVESSFSSLFHDLGYAASTISGGYDQDEMGEVIASTDDVLVLTPEKLDLLFRLRAETLDAVRVIVLDEGHLVSDFERGPKFELLISRLRRRLPDARFLMMSAVVPAATIQDFAAWLAGDSGRFVTSDWRPSLLKHGQLEWDGTAGTLRFSPEDVIEGGLQFVPNIIRQVEYSHIYPQTGRRRRPKFPRSESKGDVAAEIAYRFAPLGPVLIFTMQTDWAESAASSLFRRIELSELVEELVPAAFSIRSEGRSLVVAREWLGEEHLVTKMLRRGIAFHHGRLPAAVREAIEEDFRERRLATLVATSTLAQGVNLPVRTVVFHSVRSKNPDGTTRLLPARDYWNIAGRAGRAGSETEGTVIHVTASPYDVDDYHFYTEHRDDVERVESALHRMLRDLVQNRISSDDAAAQLDADLLALLVEEDQVALDEALLSETLGSSLFSIQAAETKLDVGPLIELMTRTARRIGETVPDPELRRLYASTGLSSRSCVTIAEHVHEHAVGVGELLSAPDIDRDVALDLLLDGLAEVREMEPRRALARDVRDLLSSWLDGELVRNMSSPELQEDSQDVTEFIEDAFSYRLPWGISSYLRIASHLTAEPVNSLVASNLAGMVKYGVPTPEAAWAMTMGVASRGGAMALARAFLEIDHERTPGSFRRWMARLDPNLLGEQLGMSGYELQSTAQAILRSQPNRYLAQLDEGQQLLPLVGTCRPTRAALNRGDAYRVAVGDPLTVARDLDSQLTRNSVVLSLRENGRLGYLDMDAARAIAPELDAGARVEAEVVSIEVHDDRPIYFEVEIREVVSNGRPG